MYFRSSVIFVISVALFFGATEAVRGAQHIDKSTTQEIDSDGNQSSNTNLSSDNPKETSLKDAAFQAAQLAGMSAAAITLTKMSASFSVSDSALGVLERRARKLARQRDVAERDYYGLLQRSEYVEISADCSPLDGERKQRCEELVERRQAVEKLRAEFLIVDGSIKNLNSAYYELLRPRALSAAETQALLQQDEGLLFLLVASDATYVFAITRERVAWARASEMSQEKVTRKVDALREGLQLDAFGSRGSVAESDDEPHDLRFDPALAHEFYRALVQPVESVFRGKTRLMTVSTGALASLPLSVLVLELPSRVETGEDWSAEPNFLVDRYQLATLPAVSSLEALRCFLVPTRRRHPGCSEESRAPDRDLQPWTLELFGIGAPNLGGPPDRSPPSRNLGFNRLNDGALADTEALRALPYLPGTKRELERLGFLYGGGQSELLIGDAANESAVKSNKSLGSAKYVVFSTHGLLAGEGGIGGEPGLVLTPPLASKRSAENDGLLTTSEIAALSLSADVVVLSACNTASSDGTSDEGFSGLTRAFFYAGARSVVVSHWQVSDDATSTLMTHFFSEMKNDENIERTEAMRRAMRSVRNEPRWKSPGFWGAFSLVGVSE